MSPNKQPLVERQTAAAKSGSPMQNKAFGTDGRLPSKRRNRSDFVEDACTACRKKHTKCDGKEPCARCSGTSQSDCIYEVNARVKKEYLKREIVELRRKNSLLTQCFNALATEQDTPAILQELKDHDGLVNIAQGIGSSHAPKPITNPSFTSDETSFDTTSNASDQGSQGPHGEQAQMKLKLIQERVAQEGGKKSYFWNTSSVDDLLVTQLVSIYWVWIHPAHPILIMPQFIKDYETGAGEHCSTLLLYAMCAAACDFLSPSWERIPWKATDVAALRQHFIAEVTVQEASADRSVQTTAQALAVMSLVGTRLGESSATVSCEAGSHSFALQLQWKMLHQ